MIMLRCILAIRHYSYVETRYFSNCRGPLYNTPHPPESQRSALLSLEREGPGAMLCLGAFGWFQKPFTNDYNLCLHIRDLNISYNFHIRGYNITYTSILGSYKRLLNTKGTVRPHSPAWEAYILKLLRSFGERQHTPTTKVAMPM